MLPVSYEFSAAAKADIRKVKAKIQICWTDPFIDSSIVVTSNSVNRGSRLFQVADLEKNVPVKWFYFDNNTPCKLNGEYKLMPSTDASARKTQVGWWGRHPSLSGGVFNAPYEILTLEFSSRPVSYIYVHGDNAYNEYPVDFNVYLYNGETLIYSHEIRDNDNVQYQISISEFFLFDVTKMVLEIRKWSTPGQVVKISEFYSSIVYEYDSDTIVSMNILEEMELSNGSLPIGNISCNEIDLALLNIDDRFFPGNTASELHNLMKRNRRIKAWLGFELPGGSVEMVPMGVFWSGDWNTPELGTTATTSGRDRMELLRKNEFSSSIVYSNKSLYQLAEIICEDAKETMPDLTYWIDEELKSFLIPTAWFQKKNYMEVIRELVEACLGYAYMDRNDVLRIGIFRPAIDTQYNNVDFVELNKGDIIENNNNFDFVEL